MRRLRLVRAVRRLVLRRLHVDELLFLIVLVVGNDFLVAVRRVVEVPARQGPLRRAALVLVHVLHLQLERVIAEGGIIGKLGNALESLWLPVALVEGVVLVLFESIVALPLV